MEVSNNMQKSNDKQGQANHHAIEFGCSESVLRVLALLLTLTAAILLGLDKQTKIVPLQLSPSLPPFYLPAVAKYTYVSAYVYFVAANSIACAFAAISLVIACTNKGGGKQSFLRMMIIVADLVMVALLFSSIGAATSIGIVGLKGNSHLQWKKVCDLFGKFCHQVMASVALSLLGAIAFFLLLIISVSKLQKRN
ncbi:CASP-like protein 1E2 [Bienertia sinuspersici]